MTTVEWDDIIYGDAEALVVDILTNYTPELDLVNGRPTVSTNLVGYSTVYSAGMSPRPDRWICIDQQGGLEGWPNIYKPRIDIEVRAERRSVALDISHICYNSVRRQMGKYRGFGFNLSHVKLESLPIKIPDLLEETSRYVTSLRLWCKPSDVSLPPPS